jgi:hypothetical protein
MFKLYFTVIFMKSTTFFVALSFRLVKKNPDILYSHILLTFVTAFIKSMTV